MPLFKTGRKFAAASLGLLVTFFLNASAADAVPKHVLSPHHVPPATANLQSLGHLPGGTELEVEIGLPLRNAEQVGLLLQQIYDPASTNYHHYLTPQQFTERFGPAASDYEAVKAYAQAHGLTVTKTFPNNELLVVRGPVTNIENAFHLHLLVYPHPHEARTFFAPDAEPALDLDVPVLDIGGLDNFVMPHPMSLHRSSPETLPKPNALTGSGPYGTFIGKDFRAAYAPNVSLNGAGQTVALVEFDGYYPADITSYESLANLPSVPLTNVLVSSSGSPGPNNAEVALDIEMAISMAPGLSKIMVYETGSGARQTTVNNLLTKIATDNQAMQISSSWTFGINSTTTNIFAQYGLQGQSFFNASGDSGAYTSASPPAPPTDDPFITAVGGTSLSTQGADGPWSSEVVWNWDDGTNAGGGGSSTSILIPTWQKSVSMTNNQGSTVYRNLPDVALTADNIWVYYNNGSTGEFGGTSAAAPLWAGFAALINQQAKAVGGTNIGFINPSVYALGTGTNYSAAFHDITTGDNTTTRSPSEFFAVAGYDLCTGWGTPNGANMISALTHGSPVITNQPVSKTVSSGNSVTFSVGAVVVGNSLTYQWKFNGTNINLANASSYTLANAQTSNQGNYTVVVSNSAGSFTSAVAVLTVNGPPTISSQPQNVTVPQGSSATFTVAATGSPAPTYQWQFNGTNIAGANGTSYTVSNAQLANQGNYSVIVSNIGGSVTSSNAVLTVNAPPAITTQPSTQSVNQGGHVSMTVGASGSPTLYYQWYLSGTNIPGATSATYDIPSAQFGQAGSYWAVVTNNFGSATSAVAVLTVNAPPGITTPPQNQTVPQGSNATFSVVATGSPMPTYQWQFNSANISGANNSSYTVVNAQLANQGNYSVVLSNASGALVSSAAVLTVNAPPTITSQPQNLSLLPGTNAAFSVTATGSTPLTYQWLFNTNALTDNGHITGSQTTNLLITNLIKSDAGHYLVTVSNAFGTATSSNVALNLLGVPVAFVASPGALQYNNGQFTLELTNLTGQGPIVIQTSSNLVVWTSIYTNPPSYGGFQFTDTNAANFPANFYRVLVP